MKKLVCLVVIGIMLMLNQPFAAEHDAGNLHACQLGDKSTTLVRLNEAYKASTGKFLDDGCLDKKRLFPTASITFKEGLVGANSPTVNVKNFIMDLSRACAAEPYESMYSSGNRLKLPKLNVSPEHFEDHIFVLLLQSHVTIGELPADKIEIPTGDDDTPRVDRYVTGFSFVDMRITKLTEWDLSTRQNLWKSLGFKVIERFDHRSGELALPLYGATGTSSSNEKCVLQ